MISPEKEAETESSDQTQIALTLIPLSDRQFSEREIYYSLTHDQCHFGFKHTQEQIGLWLCRCDKDARKAFLIHVTELDSELDALNR